MRRMILSCFLTVLVSGCFFSTRYPWSFPLFPFNAEAHAQTSGLPSSDLTSGMIVTTANERSTLDRRTQTVTSTADVTIVNNSGKAIALPLWAVIEISKTGVSMPTATGTWTGPDGSWSPARPYFDLSGRIGERLQPGGSVTFPVKFVRPSTLTFTYRVLVFGPKAAANQPPVFTSTPLAVAAEGLIYYYTVQAQDPEGGPVTFKIGTMPTGMMFMTEDHTLLWTPARGQAGTHPVQIVAEDSEGAATTQAFQVAVARSNQGPTITSVPVRQARAGQGYVYQVTAMDPDGDPLQYSLPEAPPGMTIDTASGRVQWTPGAQNAGSHTVKVRVRDPQEYSHTQSYSLDVVGQDFQLQVLSPSGTHQVYAGETLSLPMQANHPGAILKAEPLPENAAQKGNTFSFSPTPAQRGTYRIAFQAELGELRAQNIVEVRVLRRNRAPVFDPIALQKVREGGSLSVPVSATDPDGDPVQLAAPGLSLPNALFDAVNRRLLFSPSYAQQGSHSVRVTATDGTDTAEASIQITVEDVTPPSQVTDLVVDQPESPTFKTSADITGSVTGQAGAPPPSSKPVFVSGLSPASGRQGQSLQVELTGLNTAFDPATTTASFGDGITVQSLTVLSPTSAQARIAIDRSAATGPRSVRLTVGGQTVTSLVGFAVEPGTASVSGTLVDTLSGLPLAGATVAIFGHTGAVQTDAQGNFVLENIPVGAQSLVVTLPNYRVVKMDLTVERNTAIQLDKPISMTRVVSPPSPGGQLPRAATVASILDRGVTSKKAKITLDGAKALVTDTLVVVGGSMVGVLDEGGHQLNPQVSGEGFMSLTPLGVEQHAKALTEGGVYTLKEVVWTLQEVFHFSGGGLTLERVVSGFQKAVDEAWQDPGHPHSAMAIALFNEGSGLSPVPPLISGDTRFNRFQCFLLLSSFILENYTSLSESVDRILEQRGINYLDYLSALPPSTGVRLSQSPPASPRTGELAGMLRSVLASLLSPTQAYALPPPPPGATVLALPPNYANPESRLTPESEETYNRVWKSVTGDAIASATYATLGDAITTFVTQTTIGMLMGSAGGITGAMGGALIGASASIVGFGQTLIMKMVTAWVAAKAAVAMMPVSPVVHDSFHDDNGNLVIRFERSPTEIDLKTGGGTGSPYVGIDPELIHFSYMLYEFPDPTSVSLGDATPVRARLTLDFSDPRNFSGDYPTGRLKFVLERAGLEKGQHYYRIATIQYVRNMDGDLVKGVQHYDDNGNGLVDLVEYDGTPDEFNALDKNGDGKLDADEFRRDPHPFSLDPRIVTEALNNPSQGYPTHAELFPKGGVLMSSEELGDHLNRGILNHQRIIGDAVTTPHKVDAKIKKYSILSSAEKAVADGNAATVEDFVMRQELALNRAGSAVEYATTVSPAVLDLDVMSEKLGGSISATQADALMSMSESQQKVGIAQMQMEQCNKGMRYLDDLAWKNKADPDKFVAIQLDLVDADGKPYQLNGEYKVSELKNAQDFLKGEFNKAATVHHNEKQKIEIQKNRFLTETVPEWGALQSERSGNIVETQAVKKVDAQTQAEADADVSKLSKNARVDEPEGKSKFEFDPSASYKGVETTMDVVGAVLDSSEILVVFLNTIKILKSEFTPCMVYNVGDVPQRAQYPPSIVYHRNGNDPGALLSNVWRSSEPMNGWIARSYPGEEKEVLEVSAGFPPDFLTVDLKGRVYALNMNSTQRFGGRIFRFNPRSPYSFSREYAGNVNYYSLVIQFGRPANPVAMTVGPPFLNPRSPVPGALVQDLFLADYDMVAAKARVVRVPTSEIEIHPEVYGSGDRSHLVGQPVVESSEFLFTGPTDMELGPDPLSYPASWNDKSCVLMSDEHRIFAIVKDPVSGGYLLKKVMELPGRRFSGLAFDSGGKFYFADFHRGEIYLMHWDVLRGILNTDLPIVDENQLRVHAWLVRSGLREPGDIEVESNSLLSERALAVSFREGIQRFPLPIMGEILETTGDSIVRIVACSYLDEREAVIHSATLPPRFLVEPDYDHLERGRVTLRVCYRNSAGQEKWVERHVSLATYGATLLNLFR